MRRILTFWLFLLTLALVIIACAPVASPASRPTVIITSPPSGSVYTIGEEVVVQSTATDPAGITNVALLVDNTVVREDPSPVTQGQAQFSLIQSWIAETVGQHTLTVRATNASGATSESGIIVTVRDSSGTPQPPTVVAIATAVPIASATPIATGAAETDIPSTNPAVTVIVTATSPPSTVPPPCVPNSQFVTDVTVPDGTAFTPNAVFAKTWRVRNNGTCTWENFGLVFISGTQMAASQIYPVPLTAPGATADLVVPMTAPANYGSYKGTWRMRSAGGQLFGTNLTILINVPSPATAVPPTNTPPPTVAGCSGQPDDFSFSANSTDITSGQSVTLSWSAVTNASEVRLNGGEFSNEGVAAPGNRMVSPGATTEYKLKATCNNSGQFREKSVTINVGAPVGNFAGNWVMNFGTMNLLQNGDDVIGTYTQDFYGTVGQIEGTVTGNTLNAEWTIGAGSGDFELTLTGNGNRFNGSWGSGQYKWCGARPGENFPNGCSFAGSWEGKNAEFPDCALTLNRHDNVLTGNYCFGTLQGSITYDGELTVASGQWDTGDVIGDFKFYLDGFNALQFSGNYDDTAEWCGWRSGQSAPVPCLKP